MKYLRPATYKEKRLFGHRVSETEVQDWVAPLGRPLVRTSEYEKERKHLETENQVKRTWQVRSFPVSFS